MISIPRTLLALIAFLFGSYNGVLGLINLDTYNNKFAAVLAIGLYFVSLALTVFVKDELQMPTWVANFNLVVGGIVSIVFVQLFSFTEFEGYETWYVGGLGTVMAITAIRGHRIPALIGMSITSALTIAWGGVATIFTTGLIGSWIWVIVGIGSSYGLESSQQAAQDFYQKAIETSSLTVASSAARAERQARIDSTLKGSLPLLSKIWEQQGILSEADKDSARILEAQLRDEIRGRGLIDASLVEEIKKARLRGVEVQLLDDGGLEGLDKIDRSILVKRIVEEVAKVKTGKLVIRAVPGETWRVTVLALKKDSDAPDVFLRL